MGVVGMREEAQIASSMLDFGRVAPEMLPAIWTELLPIIEEFDGEWLKVVDPPEIFTMAMVGTIEMWAAVENMRVVGGMAAGWERHNRAAFYHILWLGGKPQHLQKFLAPGLEKIEKYALALGARDVIIVGRKGWERALLPFGYVQSYVQVRKNVREPRGN